MFRGRRYNIKYVIGLISVSHKSMYSKRLLCVKD